MILLLHVVIAMSTVGFSGITLIKPTKTKLYFSYSLIITTFLTGGYLVILSPAHLVSSCIIGLVFLGVVGSMLITASKRLVSVGVKG